MNTLPVLSFQGIVCALSLLQLGLRLHQSLSVALFLSAQHLVFALQTHHCLPVHKQHNEGEPVSLQKHSARLCWRGFGLLYVTPTVVTLTSGLNVKASCLHPFDTKAVSWSATNNTVILTYLNSMLCMAPYYHTTALQIQLVTKPKVSACSPSKNAQVLPQHWSFFILY